MKTPNLDLILPLHTFSVLHLSTGKHHNQNRTSTPWYKIYCYYWKWFSSWKVGLQTNAYQQIRNPLKSRGVLTESSHFLRHHEISPKWYMETLSPMPTLVRYSYTSRFTNIKGLFNKNPIFPKYASCCLYHTCLAKTNAKQFYFYISKFHECDGSSLLPQFCAKFDHRRGRQHENMTSKIG